MPCPTERGETPQRDWGVQGVIFDPRGNPQPEEWGQGWRMVRDLRGQHPVRQRGEVGSCQRGGQPPNGRRAGAGQGGAPQGGEVVQGGPWGAGVVPGAVVPEGVPTHGRSRGG